MNQVKDIYNTVFTDDAKTVYNTNMVNTRDATGAFHLGMVIPHAWNSVPGFKSEWGPHVYMCGAECQIEMQTRMEETANVEMSQRNLLDSVKRKVRKRGRLQV